MGLLPGLLCCLVAGTSRGEIAQADRDLVARVSQRLLAVTEPVAGLAWPPTFEIADEDKVNAFATASVAGDGPAARVVPRVVVYRGMLTLVVQGDPDRLAFILGHELGHVVLRHVARPPRGKTTFLQYTFNRDQELAADKKGLELALKAGYSYPKTLAAIRRAIEVGLAYSSFEGLSATHPSWRDRLTLLDKERASLWRAMSAFHNGSYFLLCEQYVAAEKCFRAATKEFPDCYEAWADLGYALLMQYCDALRSEDLRGLDLGQVVVGGFYRRPRSLEVQVRGPDHDLWLDAVGALREALRLQPNSALAKANLGVAYLVHPDGKNVRQARRYLQDAADKIAADKALDPMMRAAVLINAGVADLAGDQPAASTRRFEEALAAEGGSTDAGLAPALAGALLYNRALVLAASREQDKQRDAEDQLERYLRRTSPASAWWPLGYERYEKLCRALGLPAKSREELARKGLAGLRLVSAVKLASGTTVAVGQPLGGMRDKLGKAEEVPVVGGTNLVRLRYPAHGVECLATDQVLAICLSGEKAPALPLRGRGLGGETRIVRVGMTKAELDEALENEDYEFRQLDDPTVNYRFYPALGLAVRVHEGKVRELVVAQVPRRPVLEAE
jgi:hypothetical protein